MHNQPYFMLQCCIDLKKNVLHIGTTGTETPFLPEGELPECARLSGEQSDKADDVQEMEDRELAEAISKSSAEASSSSVGVGSSNGAASGSGQINTSQPFPEASILQITRLGFSREQAVKELRAANGNVELAAAALLAKSLQMPG